MATSNLRRWAAQALLPASAVAVTIKAPDAATDYIYVTKIVLSIWVHANAKAVVFRDSTPLTYAQFNDLTAASGTPGINGTVEWNFGRKGIKLAVGKTFEVFGDSATTPTGLVYAEGYQSAV